MAVEFNRDKVSAWVESRKSYYSSRWLEKYPELDIEKIFSVALAKAEDAHNAGSPTDSPELRYTNVFDRWSYNLLIEETGHVPGESL